MNTATFRQNMPAFQDAAVFPDAQVAFWLALATKMLRPERWDDLLDYGVQLFVAHHLVLAARSAQEVANGGLPGTVRGTISSEHVENLSVSYGTPGGLEGAGHWGLSTYGQQFYGLLRWIGAGGVQL